MFTNDLGDLGSIPGRVIPKTQKMVLDATLLNTQHYKVRIKGKVEQSRERRSALSYNLVCKVIFRLTFNWISRKLLAYLITFQQSKERVTKPIFSCLNSLVSLFPLKIGSCCRQMAGDSFWCLSVNDHISLLYSGQI